MKSIRLSLLLYFLALFVVALGTAYVFAFKDAKRILQDKENARRKLITDKHDRSTFRARRQFDDALIGQARTLASQAQFQFQASRTRFLWLAPLGALSIGDDPTSYLTAPLWLQATNSRQDRFAERPPNPWADFLIRLAMTEIQFNEDALHRDGEEHVQEEYFQINSESGKYWHSHSLGDRFLPFDPSLFAQMQMHKPNLDNVELEPGLMVRRVMLKAPVAKQKVFPPDRPERIRQTLGQGPRPSTPREPRDMLTPSLFIQCAAETDHLETALAGFKLTQDNELAELAEESTTTLATLRNRLLLIGLGSFAAIVLGGFFLVRHGLMPLQRLSEAVSLVSAKDFRLPVERTNLPVELRPIADRLTQTFELLQRAFDREKQAAADISHELRTPLAALLTTVEVALRKPRPTEEYREILQDCHAAGQQMSQLVERMLALARLDAGVDTMRPRSVDVANLADRCVALVKPLADARGLALKVHADGPVRLNTDPDKLHEVLTNLLHNAIDYNRPGGRVDLTMAHDDGAFCLEVRDTGVGIAASDREHIFERFYRADRSRNAEGLHSGLGLSIVKGYVDLMGGSITVESAEGQGSSFRLKLPAEGAKPGHRLVAGGKV